jgi:hypothetical protein
VIDFIIENNIKTVKGNHESMLLEVKDEALRYVDTGEISYVLDDSDFALNKGIKTLDEYRNSQNGLNIFKKHIKFLEELPLFIKTGITDPETSLELLVSHAYCLRKNLEFEYINEFNFVWDREQPHQLKNNSKYYNVYGHTPTSYVNKKKYNRINGPIAVPEPEYFDGACNIDTGAPYNSRARGYLTGVFYPSLDEIQVKTKFQE